MLIDLAFLTGPGKDQISKRANEGGAEVDFYKGFSKMDWKGGEKFFPKFFGTFENEDGFYMIMEDLMAGKGAHCCVLDVKMGTQTYAPDAAPEKVDRFPRTSPSRPSAHIALVRLRIRARTTPRRRRRCWGSA